MAARATRSQSEQVGVLVAVGQSPASWVRGRRVALLHSGAEFHGFDETSNVSSISSCEQRDCHVQEPLTTCL
jgi:hypothetical protein